MRIKRLHIKSENKFYIQQKQLIQNPKSGQIELYLEKLNDQHRYILSKNFKIIYKVNRNYIVISDIFDTRQNPIKMVDDQRNKK